MVYRFGTFEFDAAAGELRKNGRGTAIEPQPAKALALLLARAGDIVSREDLKSALWGSDTHVDFERGIAYCISQVRTALGDSGENPRFVQTIPKRGFKFIAPVTADALPSGAVVLPILQAPPPFPPVRTPSRNAVIAGAIVFAAIAALALYAERRLRVPPPAPAIIGVSIFDNETGLPEHDRLVAGLTDLVVERLSKIDSDRVAVIGNAAVLRQPRNIRNLRTVATSLRADYVLLGQLQKGETGLRFITHFIRLSDEAHLKANRLTMADGGVTGMEQAVVEEFERATRRHVLNQSTN